MAPWTRAGLKYPPPPARIKPPGGWMRQTRSSSHGRGSRCPTAKPVSSTAALIFPPSRQMSRRERREDAVSMELPAASLPPDGHNRLAGSNLTPRRASAVARAQLEKKPTRPITNADQCIRRWVRCAHRQPANAVLLRDTASALRAQSSNVRLTNSRLAPDQIST